MDDTTAAPDVTQAAPNRWRRLLEWLHRYRYALAPVSFAAGVASFFLIQRQEPLAQWISALLIVGWLLMIFEEAAARRLRLSPAVLRFGIQAIQQETFFFTLPFLLQTTTWNTGQAVFTGAVVLAALGSLWDPLYYRGIAARPWLYLAFHAFAVFVGTLTVAPILLHLTTGQTLVLAAASIAVLAVPSLLHVIDRSDARQWLLLFAGAGALGGLAWSLKPWVPPATLWVQDAVMTDRVDADTRTPGVALWSVSSAHLHEQGLFAYTAIHAPRGLREQVHHRWVHAGREVDRIPLDIVGGRAEGYRAWSYKKGFPADPRGDWQVQVVTDGGQLIGQLAFAVVGEMPAAPPAPPAPPAEPAPAPAESVPETAPQPETVPEPAEPPMPETTPEPDLQT
jgi:hypothetical protein